MTNKAITGSLAMVPALERMRRADAPLEHQAAEFYQTSILGALFEGVYDGDVTYGSLREHGDFGLGTFNELDGEMVAFDGEFYQLRADGTARPVDPQQKTPFAVVTFFRPEIEREISSPLTKVELETFIDGLTNDNLFYAIRVDGIFSEISTRTVKRQAKPYVPLSEAARQEETNRSVNVRGTLAGFRAPPYAQIVSGAGYHLHFLREDRLAGDTCSTMSSRKVTSQSNQRTRCISNAIRAAIRSGKPGRPFFDRRDTRRRTLKLDRNKLGYDDPRAPSNRHKSRRAFDKACKNQAPLKQFRRNLSRAGLL